MRTLLIEPISLLVTMDAEGRELRDAAVLIRDGVIEAVGPCGTLGTASEVVDASRRLVMISTRSPLCS